MAKILHPQFSFANGQVTSDLYQRGDLKSYYLGAKRVDNCFCKMTGGVKKRYGSEYLFTPYEATPLVLSAGNFTLTNLATGAAADLIDGDRATTITTNVAATADFEVFLYDLGAETYVEYVDIFDFYIVGWSGDPGNHIKLMVSANGVDYVEVTTGERNFYSSGSKQDLSYNVHSYIRYVKLLSAESYPANALSISEVKIFSHDNTQLSTVRFSEITLNDYIGESVVDYMVVFADYHAHLYDISGEMAVYSNCIYTGIARTYLPTISITVGDNSTFIITESRLNPIEIRAEDLFTDVDLLCAAAFRYAPISLLNVPKYNFNPETITTATGFTLTPSATTGYITCTSSGAVFVAGDVGQKIIVDPIGTIRVTEYTSTTVVKGFVEDKLQSTGAIPSANWAIHRGYDDIFNATNGWPLHSAFYAGRLFFAGSKGLPAVVAASTIEDNYDFDVADQSDSDGFWSLLQTRKSSIITALKSSNSLEVYTDSGVFVLQSGTAITPTNISIKRNAPVGSANRLDPAETQSSGSIYINKQRNGIYRFVYSDDILSYKSECISELAGDLVSVPNNINYSFDVWRGDSNIRNDVILFVNEDYDMVVASIMLEEGVRAFSKWIAYDIDGDGDRSKMSIISAGASKYGIPVLMKRYDDDYQVCVIRDGFNLDCSSFPTPVGTVISDLDYLDGDTIDVIGDGEYLGTFDVENEQVDLGDTYTTVEVGFGVWPEIETLPIEDVEQIGSSIGKSKNISEVYINPVTLTNLYINDELVLDVNEENAVIEPIVTRTLRGWSREKTITISQTKPLSLEIKNILVTAEVNA